MVRTRNLARTLGVMVLLVLAAAAALPSGAAARQPLETVLQDDYMAFHRTDDEVRAAMKQMRALGVDRVRLTAGWSVIAPEPDSFRRPNFDATDPDAYPRANWRHLDRAVRAAREAGLEVMIDIAFWTPHWAAADGRGTNPRKDINVGEFTQFAEAVVKRYSGSFTPEFDDGSDAPPSLQGWLQERFGGLLANPAPPVPAAPDLGPLPKVTWWTIWNEPNHPGFLLPQYRRQPDGSFVPESPRLYRRLVEASYPAIKRIQPDSFVLIGGLTSIGAKRPTSESTRMPPLEFLRELACVDRKLRPLHASRCAGFKRVPGDGFSHHPYSRTTRPNFHDRANPDTARIGDIGRLTKLLDRLARMGRIDRKLRNVYLTEFGYESSPPEPTAPFTPAQQARNLAWSEYLAWRNPQVRSWPQFLLRDLPETGWNSGLLFRDGRPKPAATSFRLTLHAQCVGRRVLIWGHSRPGWGVRRVTIETRPSLGRWHLAQTARSAASRGRSVAFATKASGTFVRWTKRRLGTRYRLREADGRGLAVAPTGCAGRAHRG